MTHDPLELTYAERVVYYSGAWLMPTSKACDSCGKVMEPKTWGNGVRESIRQYERRRNCDASCAARGRR